MIKENSEDIVNKYADYAIKLEGDVNHFYLDTNGNVTVGRGHLVANKTALKNLYAYFRLHDGKTPATIDEVNHDYEEVAKKPFGNFKADFYDSSSRLRLSSAGLKESVKQDANQKLIALIKGVPHFREFPSSAQLLLIDLAYNSGEGHITGRLVPSKNNQFDKVYFAPIRQDIKNRNWLGLKKSVQALDDHLMQHKRRNKSAPLISQARYKQRKRWLNEAINYQSSLATRFNLLSFANLSPFQVDSLNDCVKGSNSELDNMFLEQNHSCLDRFNNNLTVLTGIPFEPIATAPDSTTSKLLQIHTPLPDKFIITQLTGHEALSKPFQFHATVYSTNTQLTGKDLLAKPVTIKLTPSINQPARYIHGLVGRFLAGTVNNGWRQYTLEIVPALALLSMETDYRIFHQQTVLDIIEKCLRPHGIRVNYKKVHGELPKRDYCVQYGETTWHFIQRLLADEGIWYYFVFEEASHILTLADQPYVGYDHQANLQVRYRPSASEQGELYYWEQQGDYYTNDCVQHDYGFTQAATHFMVNQVAC